MAGSLHTRAVHAGDIPGGILGAVVTPVFQSAMTRTVPGTSYYDQGYLRFQNSPTHQAVQHKLAALEAAEASVVAASGMAAIAAAVLSVLKSGDRLMAQGRLYGGTVGLFQDYLPQLGIAVDTIDPRREQSWAGALTSSTRAIYVETIANPTMDVPDLLGVVRFARAHGLVALIDNTFASPVNFRPIEHGFDLSLHSATKYLNGHSDIVAGAVVGSAGLVERVRRTLAHLGGALDPHACFLLARGLMTLPLRVERQNASALALAQALEDHPAVARVHYPGLPSHPDHQRARALFVEHSGGGFGGMLSIELRGGAAAADALLDRLSIPLVAPSLGSVHTLVTRPAATSHAGLTAADRDRLGIAEGLVRISVGIEGTDDLIADFRQALDGL